MKAKFKTSGLLIALIGTFPAFADTCQLLWNDTWERVMAGEEKAKTEVAVYIATASLFPPISHEDITRVTCIHLALVELGLPNVNDQAQTYFSNISVGLREKIINYPSYRDFPICSFVDTPIQHSQLILLIGEELTATHNQDEVARCRE